MVGHDRKMKSLGAPGWSLRGAPCPQFGGDTAEENDGLWAGKRCDPDIEANVVATCHAQPHELFGSGAM